MSRNVKDWISGFEEYTFKSEPPDLYKKWVAISAIASALQRKTYLEWGSITFYPNMYIVLVGPSGKCRKGTAMGPANAILRELGINMAAEAITREALIREMKNAAITTITPETGEVDLHSSLTIYSQELTVFLGYNNTQLMSDLTDWYDCAPRWVYRTKNMGTDDIIGVWVNLIGATTPELIQTALPRDAVGGGLTSRIIFVFEDKKGKISPCPFLSEKEIMLKEDLVIDLEKINMMRGPFKVTEDFIEKYSKWYIKQEDNPPFADIRFAGYFERRPNHTMKLSMIISASEGDKMIITGEHFERALSIILHTEKKMPYTFGGLGRAQMSETLHNVMVHIGSVKTLTFKDLMNMYRYDATKDELMNIIETLKSMGFCSLNYDGQEWIIKYTKKE